MNAGEQALVSNVQQGHARGFINAARFGFDDAVFDLVAHAQAVAAANAVGFEKQFYRVGIFFAVQSYRHAFFKAHAHFFGLHFYAFIPKCHAHNRLHNFDAGVEKFQIFGFMGGAEHIGISGIGFFYRHFVVKAVGNQKFAHFLAAAQFIDKGLVEPRFVDAQAGVGDQAVAVEALDVVAFIGGAVAPDIHIVFFHRGHQHGAGNGAAQRRGVEISDAAGGHMKRAALNRGDALVCQLAAAIDQARFNRAIGFGFLRNGIVIFFIRLAEVGGVSIGQRTFELHPQQCGRSIEAA